MRQNRYSSNHIESQRAAIYSEGNNNNNNNRGRQGLLLPPINKKNQRNDGKGKEEKKPQDKYEQMRNRSKNNAERNQQLKDIRYQYTLIKGKEKAVKSAGREHKNNHNDNNNDFEMFEIEKVENNEENIANILQPKKNSINGYKNNHKNNSTPNNNKNNTKQAGSKQGNENAQDDIEELEKELARLKMDIHEREESISQLDQLQQKAQEKQQALNQQYSPLQQQKQPQQQQQKQQQQQEQPDLKNMVFGQRVKGKDMNDYWNNQDQKTTFKVQQNPGGSSQVTIGDDYNFFKDKENENYKVSKLGRNYYSPINSKKQSQTNENQDYLSAQEQQLQYNQQQRKNREENHSSKKHFNNDQNYTEENGKPALLTEKQQQQANYASQLQEQIASKKGPPKGQIQSINIFEGYQGKDGEPKYKGGQQASQFINSLYYHQEKEPKSNNNVSGKYHNKNETSDQTVDDSKKVVRVTQPPGGRSQIVFG